jgi:putative acetyltransferase
VTCRTGTGNGPRPERRPQNGRDGQGGDAGGRRGDLRGPRRGDRTRREAYDDEQVAAWARGLDPEGYPIETADRFVVAEAQGAVVGFGELAVDPGEYLAAPVDAEVRAVYVRPEVAREGVGSALLADLEAAARERGAETLGLWASLNAVPFYESQGYARVGERTHEFSGADERAPGIEARVVEMRRELD